MKKKRLIWFFYRLIGSTNLLISRSPCVTPQNKFIVSLVSSISFARNNKVSHEYSHLLAQMKNWKPYGLIWRKRVYRSAAASIPKPRGNRQLESGTITVESTYVFALVPYREIKKGGAITRDPRKERLGLGRRQSDVPTAITCSRVA